jgi:CRP-like cAMP-binding protein
MLEGNDRAEPASHNGVAPISWPAMAAVGTVNALLCQLSTSGISAVLRCAERVALERRQVIQERHTALKYAYFIESGAGILLAKAGGDWASVEIRTLGARDFVGLPLLLGVEQSPHHCTIQLAGEALRLRGSDLDRLLTELPEFRGLMLRYAHEVFVHSSQLVACNTRHNLKQRLSRWLLVASDRMDSDQIDLSPDGLSRAIAARRTGVTTEMGRMEQAGLIGRAGGSILITDRDGLENASCSCHRVLRAAGGRFEPAAGEARTLRPITENRVDKPRRHPGFTCREAA